MFLFSSCGLPRLTNFHHSGHVLTFSTRPTGRYVKTKFLKNKKVATKSYSTHVYQISVSLDVRLGGYGPTIFIILVFFAPFFGLFSHITFNFNKFKKKPSPYKMSLQGCNKSPDVPLASYFW